MAIPADRFLSKVDGLHMVYGYNTRHDLEVRDGGVSSTVKVIMNAISVLPIISLVTGIFRLIGLIQYEGTMQKNEKIFTLIRGLTDILCLGLLNLLVDSYVSIDIEKHNNRC